MSDPVRLLNSSGGQHPLERAVLESLRAVAVPAQAKGVVWGALSASVAEGGALAGATAGTASAWRGAFKLLVSPKALVAVPVVVAALGAGALHQRSAAPAPAPLPAAVVAQAVQPNLTPPVET